VLWEERKAPWHGLAARAPNFTSAVGRVRDPGGRSLLCGLGCPSGRRLTHLGRLLGPLGIVNPHKVFAVCFLAVLGGDCIAFALGTPVRLAPARQPPGSTLFQAAQANPRTRYFRKFGSKVISLARFLPGLRFSIFLSAGTLRVRPSVFITYDSLAAWVSVLR